MLSATDFSIFLPADVSLVIESRNIPDQQRYWEMTPLYKSLREVNWGVILQAVSEGDDSWDAGEVRDLFAEINGTWKSLQAQFSDSSVFAVGDVNNFFEMVRKFDEKMEHELEIAVKALGEDGETDAENGEDGDDKLEPDELALMQSLMGGFYLMVDVKDMAEVERILDGASDRILEKDKDKTLIKFDEDGVSGLEITEDGESLAFGLYWTLKENLLILGLTREAVRTQLAWIQSPPVNSLANDGDYIHARQEMIDGYHSLIYLPVGRGLKHLLDFIQESGDVEDPEVLNRIRKWLDPEAILPISQSFKYSERDWSTRAMAGFRRECGLQRLLLAPWGEAAPQPPFAHRNFGSVSCVSWSIRRFYDALEAELPKIANEAAAGLGMARMMAAGQLGFDYKLQFLDHLGDGVAVFQTVDPQVVDEILEASFNENFEEQIRLSQKHPTGGEYYLIGLELKNTDVIRQSLHSLVAKLHPQGVPEPEAYRGVPLYSPLPDFGGGASATSMLTYAFLDNYLLVAVGKPGLLHMAVDASQDPQLRVWNHDEYTALRDRFQFQAQGMDFTSGRIIDTLITMFKKGLLAGMSREMNENSAAAVSQELGKISFGVGGSLSLHRAGALEVRTHTVQEYKH